MKEADDNQDKIGGEQPRLIPPDRLKKAVFRSVLFLSALMLLPLCIELGLRLGGYGETSSLFVESPNPEMHGWVDNPGFTAPFFSRSLERTPAPFFIPGNKPDDELRIVVLGASAAMGDPMPEFGLPRMIQALMDLSVTGKNIRVINAAITAINSHVVRVIARDCMKIQPDAVVIYLGNNEIVGPFGPGTVFSGFYKSRLWIKVATWARRLRLGQLMTSVRDAVSKEGQARREWAGMEMFLAGQFDADDPDVVIAREHFKANLDEIVTLFVNKNIPVVLSTIAVNHDDFPPFLGIRGNELYENAKKTEEQGDRSAAWELYQDACDSDQLRFRADTGINAAIREVADCHTTSRLQRVDAAMDFRDLYESGVPGSTLFVDHVHFTINGNYRLARMISKALSQQLPLDEEALTAVDESACRERVAYTAWAEQAIWNKMKNRFLRPLFRKQLNHLERLKRVAASERNAEAAKQAIDTGHWLSIMNSFLAVHPEDTDLLLWRGRFYLHEKNLEKALDSFTSAARLLPDRPTPQGHISFMETMMYGSAKALEHFNASWQGPQSRKPGVIHYIGEMLRDNGKYEEAAAWFSAGAGMDENYPGMLTQLGYVYLSMGKADEAIAVFQRALKRNPQDRIARSYLGVSYGVKNDWSTALQNLALAVEQAPDDPELRYNYAYGLMQVDKVNEAAREFDLLLTQNPTDYDAATHYINLLWQTNNLEKAASVCSSARDFYPDQSLLFLRMSLIEARGGNVENALNILKQVKDAGTGKQQALAALLSAWLEATRSGESLDDEEFMSAYLSRRANDSAEPSALLLIRPAVLQRLGRQREADQQLQAARIFLEEPDESVGVYLAALKLAIQRNVPFEIPKSVRIDDPVLMEIWNQL